MNISLARALRASTDGCIAFTGAGGKTTALFQLADELSRNAPVIVTASSHLGLWQTAQADRHLICHTVADLDKLDHTTQGITVITAATDGDRTRPLAAELLLALHRFCESHSLPLLIEADGSRQKPLKAWAEHEPPIPSFVDQVVHVVGLTGIGKVLDDRSVHRPELFSKLSTLTAGSTITPEALTRVLIHPHGGQKNIPPGARKVALLNQADTPELQSTAHGMAHNLLSAFQGVVAASLLHKEIYAVHEPVAGIVLAGGESKRLGQPKQLLDWRGQTFVHAVAKAALEAGLYPVVVVTGANAERVEAAVKDLNVQIVNNEDWASGQGSSIRTGVKNLIPKSSSAIYTGAAIFLLVDQPQITISILRALVEKHSEGLYPIVAPMVIDRRANPVLFDATLFPDLLELEGDVGGRAVFHKHRVEYLPWHDDRLLLDVDTLEQYQRLITDETL